MTITVLFIFLKFKLFKIGFFFQKNNFQYGSIIINQIIVCYNTDHKKTSSVLTLLRLYIFNSLLLLVSDRKHIKKIKNFLKPTILKTEP